MVEFKKRETAYKLKIGDLLAGTPIVEDIPQDPNFDPTTTNSSSTQATKERFRFLELGNKHIVRVNIIANVVDKYISEGEKKYVNLTIDDASGQIRLKAFGEEATKISDYAQGDTLLVIGVLRSYNSELYISPEITKKVDTRYLLVRKLELEKGQSSQGQNTQLQQQTPQKLEVRDQIIQIIKSSTSSDGVSTEEIILKITNANPETINHEIIRLLEDGVVYEPRPGKVRYLG
jgi:DNA polymerase III alpha subunit